MNFSVVSKSTYFALKNECFVGRAAGTNQINMENLGRYINKGVTLGERLLRIESLSLFKYYRGN